MSRWKGLPADLDPSVRNLVARSRRLKDHSGLSLRQLAAKTGYSTSSWERYLGGRSLPPRGAVEALASVTGEDPTRLLALWEVAAEAWTSGRPAPTASDPDSAAEPTGTVHADLAAPADLTEPAAEPSAGPTRGRALPIVLATGVVLLGLAVSVAVVLAGRTGEDGDRAAAPPTSSAAAAVVSSPADPPSYTCRIQRVDGHWYAGLDRTRDAILADGRAGPKVAEVQCLLERAGYAPGDIDGIYGPLTERAVKRLQQDADLVVDGVVGPHTWGALRE